MWRLRWIVAAGVAVAMSSIGAAALATGTGQSGDEAIEVTPAASGVLSPLSDRRVVTGWIPYWSLDEGMASVLDHPSVFAEVSPFWYSITRSAGVGPMPENFHDESELVTAINELHAAGIAAFPTVNDAGFDGHDMARLLGDKAKRTNLVQALVSMVDRTGADGVDIDFESMNWGGTGRERTAVKHLFPVFLERLQNAVHADGKLLSVALPPRRSASDDNWETIDYDAIGRVVDRARVMTYDYSTDQPGPIGPIRWTRDVVEYAHREFKGVPLSVGVAGYGRNWYVKTLRGSCPGAAKKTVDPTTLQAFERADEFNADIRWSKDAQESHYDYRRPYPEYGRCVVLRRVWFGDGRSAEARLQLAKRLGVQGIAVFSFGFEDPRLLPKARSFAASLNPDPAKVTIQAPDAATAGDVITVSGRVSVSGTPLGSLTVTLQKRVPHRSWQNVADVTTGANGGVSWSPTAQRTLDWRWKVPAGWDWRTSYSGSHRVVIN
jgi:spore germination protein YaaH